MEIKTMEEAATVYRKIEASLERKKAEFEQTIVKEKQALEQLQTIMTAMLNQAGVKSMNIPGVGAPTLTLKRAFGCGDWDMLFTWLVVNNVPELLQKRIHEGNMQAWIDAHPGQELPPGVNVFSENVFKMLKAK